MQLIGNKLIVGFHEWAWSLRTQGFPVFAVLEDGQVVKIGVTTKGRETYYLPEGTVAVVRKYYTNRGYLTIFVYLIQDGKVIEVIVDEGNDFEQLNQLPPVVQKAVDDMIGE